MKLEMEKQKCAESTGDWLTSQYKEMKISKELHLLKSEKSKIIEYDKKINDIQNFKQKRSKFNFKVDRKDGIIDETVEEKNDYELFLPEDSENLKDDSSDEEELENKYHPIKVNMFLKCKYFTIYFNLFSDIHL